MKSDIVLTVMHRMAWKSAKPFLLSLRATDFDGKVVIFSSMMSGSARQELENLGATVVPFLFLARHVRQRLAKPWNLWRRYFALPQPQFLKDAASHRILHLFYLRHLIYLRFIESNASIGRVLMCDCRDVYFQRNPFANWPGDGLHAFEEDTNILIGEDAHHRRWITQLAGPNVLEELSDKPRVCAGTILGDRESAIRFLRDMVDMTYKAKSLEPFDGDQGLFNILVHKVRPSYVIQHQNGSSSVYTVGSMPNEKLITDTDGYILGGDGRRSPILHQYDRKPEIARVLLDHLQSALAPNSSL